MVRRTLGNTGVQVACWSYIFIHYALLVAYVARSSDILTNFSGIPFLIRERRRRLQLHKIKDHRDRWVEGEDNIAKAAIRHFHKRFNIKHQFNDNEILECIPRIITEEDNIVLTTIPNTEEIRDVVFDMGANSAAGPDGFNDTFFQKCWDIIKDDITGFMQEIFNGKRLTKFFSHTCLVLLPKVESPVAFQNFDPSV
ncbi:PREDICTED: uncharacterized protein LOC109213527 [Nicotiana attenuata]|uniref:uncharacterized protein LOC109213527 n=1 Tax=Nicotiana attenuata TaxID=49451 RepID=UPI0009055B12|nr:PREDICTED: uncharacterized protein LOC109213527 [Nicotiana attenuata]